MESPSIITNQKMSEPVYAVFKNGALVELTSKAEIAADCFKCGINGQCSSCAAIYNCGIFRIEELEDLVSMFDRHREERHG